jgi:hypothetical protein
MAKEIRGRKHNRNDFSEARKRREAPPETTFPRRTGGTSVDRLAEVKSWQSLSPDHCPALPPFASSSGIILSSLPRASTENNLPSWSTTKTQGMELTPQEEENLLSQ